MCDVGRTTALDLFIWQIRKTGEYEQWNQHIGWAWAATERSAAGPWCTTQHSKCPSRGQVGTKRLPQIQETTNSLSQQAGSPARVPFFLATEGSLSQRKVSAKDLLFADTLDFEIQSSFLMEHFFKKSLKYLSCCCCSWNNILLYVESWTTVIHNIFMHAIHFYHDSLWKKGLCSPQTPQECLSLTCAWMSVTQLTSEQWFNLLTNF